MKFFTIYLFTLLLIFEVSTVKSQDRKDTCLFHLFTEPPSFVKTDTTVIEYFPSGQLRHLYLLDTYLYSDGNEFKVKNHKSYYEDGQIAELETDSIIVEWYTNGQVRRKYFWYYNRPLEFEYYENGSLKRIELSFKPEVGGGASLIREFYNTGILKEEIIIENFGFVKHHKSEFDERGERQRHIVMDERSNYLFSEKDGKRIYYDPPGQERIEEKIKREAEAHIKLKKIKFKKFAKIPGGEMESILLSSKVKMNQFLIHKTEVSNKEYRKFLQILIQDSADVFTKKDIDDYFYPHINQEELIKVKNKTLTLDEYFSNPKYNDYPVVGVNYFIAKYYCEWLKSYLTKKLKIEELSKYIILTLPCQTEWEYVASVGEGLRMVLENFSNSGENFNILSSDKSNAEILPVKSLKAGPYGTFNLIGNVPEWSVDFYLNNNTNPPTLMFRPLSGNPQLVDKNKWQKVILGGGGQSTSDELINNRFIESLYIGEGCNKVTGFRPVMYFVNPSDKVGIFFNGEWYEF